MSNGVEKNKVSILRGALNQDGFAETTLSFNLAACSGGVSEVRQASAEHARHAITIIISLSLQLTTCKLIKERMVTERFFARFSAALCDEFVGLH